MTNQICPIMSKPSQGNTIKLYSDKPLFESEDEMRKYGWVVMNGKPFSGVVMCQKEKCMSWQQDTVGCANANRDGCEQLDCGLCGTDECKHWKPFSREDGFCKLIEKQL